MLVWSNLVRPSASSAIMVG
jgi:hypothetical protein